MWTLVLVLNETNITNHIMITIVIMKEKREGGEYSYIPI